MIRNNYKIKSISIDEALNKKTSQWIDIRSPREYKKGHFTNAINFPLFSNKEFAELGTVYNTTGQKKAVELGQKYANKISPSILNKISNLKCKNIIIYCARGGMRSKGVQSLLVNAGFSVDRISRGYKSIREHTLNSFDIPRELIIIGGNTGSGKTVILNEMKDQGYPIIDLEKIANHRGSVFGDLGLSEQATQQQFENDLSNLWIATPKNSPIYIESESRKIGKVVIPTAIWENMLIARYIKIDMNISRRVNNLLEEYGKPNSSTLKQKIDNITKRLGGQNAKIAKQKLDDNNLSEFCEILLKNYYDKLYQKSYDTRNTEKQIIAVKNESNQKIISKIVEAVNE